MAISTVRCNNSFRCWECNEKCYVKVLFVSPEPEFYAHLWRTYKANVGMMVAAGVPFKEAVEQQDIVTVTLVTSRMMFLNFM